MSHETRLPLIKSTSQPPGLVICEIMNSLTSLVHKRGIRIAALREKRITDALRGLPTKKPDPSGRPKRDPTTYGIPRIKPQDATPEPPEKDTPAYAEYMQHPLWQFFHGKDAVELPDVRKDASGRSWRAPELRLKSFEDLHRLWYILLKERNVLETQKLELKKNGISVQFTELHNKSHRCRKGMARIKFVLNERRRAAIEAGQIMFEEAQQRGLPAPKPEFSPDDPLYEALPTPKLERVRFNRPVKVHRPKAFTNARSAQRRIAKKNAAAGLFEGAPTPTQPEAGAS